MTKARQQRRLNIIYQLLGKKIYKYKVYICDSYISVRNIQTGKGWYSDNLQWIKRKLKKDLEV